MTTNKNGKTPSDLIAAMPRWIIAGALAAIASSFVFILLWQPPRFEFFGLGFGVTETQNTEAAGEGIPSGAVVAFLSSETEPCRGEEWSLYDDAKGRFIVGAGHNHENDLTLRLPGDTGGEEAHTLKINELPLPDFHLYLSLAEGEGAPLHWQNSPKASQNKVVSNQTTGEPTELIKRGAGTAHNNMPPFIALYYCKKS